MQRHWRGKGPGVLGRLGTCVPAGLMLQLTSPQHEQRQLPLCRVCVTFPLYSEGHRGLAKAALFRGSDRGPCPSLPASKVCKTSCL